MNPQDEQIADVDVLINVGEDPRQLLREIREEEAERLIGRKFEFYEPNGKCEEFINAVGSGDYFVILFSAANGVGKTAAGANVVANLLNPGCNPWFDLPAFNDFPHLKRGRVVSDPNNLKNIINSLQEWLPVDTYETRKANKAYESEWTCGEWKFDIMSYEQDPKEFEGETLGWVWFDEPPPEPIYKACVARLRRGGVIFITETPLEGSGWLYDAFVNGATEVVGMDGNKIQRKVKYIEAGVEAACKEHGVRGHLSHDHIEQMVAEYDDDDKQARVHGKFQHLAGMVFKRFDKQIHVVKPFEVTLRDFTVFQALDPHPRVEDANLWLAVDRKGRKFVVDEMFMKCNGLEEMANRIKKKDSQYRVVKWLADPSAFVEDQHRDGEQKSLASKLSDYGLDYAPATKFRAQADRRIKDAMDYQQLPGGEFISEPELFIFDSCTRLIWEIEHYRWDEWKGKTGENKNKKQKPVDKDDHLVECLGRLLLLEPVFEEMEIHDDYGEEPNYDPY